MSENDVNKYDLHWQTNVKHISSVDPLQRIEIWFLEENIHFSVHDRIHGIFN